MEVDWEKKNSSDLENMNWILANTKSCPKCGVVIQRHSGCNQMGQRGESYCCGHLWCWECGADWKTHGPETGGWYKCNIAANPTGELAIKLGKIKAAGNEAQFYSEAIKHFDNNQRCEKHAFKMLTTMDSRIEFLHTARGTPASDS